MDQYNEKYEELTPVMIHEFIDKIVQENLIKTIFGFYDQNEEFQKNDRYQSVYKKQDDNAHWFVATPHNNNRLEIHQTLLL